MSLPDLIAMSRDATPFTHDQLVTMLGYPETSPESYALMAEARRVSELASDGQAEIHGQFALDLAPCSCNCGWCSFARRNGVFKESWRLEPEDAVALALKFEAEGANSVLAMTTRDYPNGLMLEIGREMRRALKPSTVLIANTGDRTPEQARRLKEAGFDGVYHALRLGEGVDNELTPEARIASIRSFQEAGLWVGTCVEPVGPEHGNDELARLIAFTASFHPAFSGAARRIPIPGTAMAARGAISELRMAQIVAVTRLAMPYEVRGNCTHEPCTLGAMAGANLFWAEIGANPRDDHERTEDNRGKDTAYCARLFGEAGWKVLNGASRHYSLAPVPKPPVELAQAV